MTLVVTGVAREAATLRGRDGLIVVAGGGNAAGLERTLEAHSGGAAGLVSFGMAGALDPALKIGDWVIGERVAGGFEHDCDRGWATALAAGLPGARLGAAYADGRMIADPAEKRALGRRHGCVAVDMESHVAARVAARHGLRFAIVRCISDRADHALPPAIAVAMRADGGIDGAAMLRNLVAAPGQIGGFVATIAGFARAMRALRRGAAGVDLAAPAA